ncbi:hypothetical protein GCM10007385_33700 [Tateyamaria omphalii]|uniref:hypothetical protein n=1 Tax=Tateyamaria omphalii TaxID=299262 RepID=UPI00167BA84C|nr:hypothetical protein [Tateyamaria omphalii]GGX61865.1 hypothetical protein GCM10007385_33700 [Tateyamaria omphalii]
MSALLHRIQNDNDFAHGLQAKALDVYGQGIAEAQCGTKPQALSPAQLETLAVSQNDINANADTTAFDTTAFDTTAFDTTAFDTTAFDTTAFDTTAFAGAAVA